jgi:hypothetical protein
MGAKERDESYSDKEAARRRDEVVKQMLNTPPQPRKPASKAKTKPRGKT